MKHRTLAIWISVLGAAGSVLALSACKSNEGTPTVSEQPRAAQESRWSSAEYAAMAEQGQKVFAAQCARCHTVDGLANTAGPDLSDYGSEGWSHVRTADTVYDAQRYYPGTKMTSFGEKAAQNEKEKLTNPQIDTVVAYVVGLRKRADYLPENQADQPAR